MDQYFRNLLWLILLTFLLMACQPQGNPSAPVFPLATLTPNVLSRNQYALHQRMTLVNEGPGQPEKQNLWVALIQTILPYQEVLSLDITPNKYIPVTDEYGNQYAEFDLSEHPAGTSISIKIDYQLVVNELVYDLSVCEGELVDEFTQPELHIESDNPQIVTLANELSQGKQNICQQVEAFYNYVGDELVYNYNGKDWGAQAALGPMGSDCTEYTALLVALSRAQRIPARYLEGLLVLDKDTRDLAQLEHAWADVFLPGIGWMGIDPTLGRSPVYRKTYFAHYTPDHIIVTLGANPSSLRGSSYWTHIYWPGNSTKIHVEGDQWQIEQIK